MFIDNDSCRILNRKHDETNNTLVTRAKSSKIYKNTQTPPYCRHRECRQNQHEASTSNRFKRKIPGQSTFGQSQYALLCPNRTYGRGIS